MHTKTMGSIPRIPFKCMYVTIKPKHVLGLTRKSIGLEVRSRDEIGAALVNIGLAAASGGLISAILYKIG